MSSLSSTFAPPEIALAPPRCRCCGSGNVCERGVKSGRRFARDYHYYACEACGFLFVEPVADPSIYDDDYYDGRGVDPLVNYREEYENYAGTPRLLEFEDLYHLAEDHLPRADPAQERASGRAWLDFGCGAGGLLKFLRERGGFEVAGHDVGSYAERLRRDDGFTLFNLEELQALPDGRYDVISCIEVLEHVPEPRPLIALVARLLRPGGLLILTTGNLASPVARWQGLSFSYCIPEIHVSLFNPRLLATLYTEAGLTPVRVRYTGSIRFRIQKSLRLANWGRRLRWLALLPPLVRLADALYGVSAMPCATKPPLAPLSLP